MRGIPALATRVAATTLLALGTAGWIGVGCLPWLSSSWTQAVQRDGVEPERLMWLPWLDAPARGFARRELQRGSALRDDTARKLLEQSARARPLYAPTWLLLAELAWRAGETGRARELAHIAVSLWPGREHLLWSAVALAAEMDEREAALRLLARIFSAAPERVDRVVFVGRRLEPDAARLLDGLVPEAERATPSGQACAIQLLANAARVGDAALAEAAWRALDAPARGRRDVLELHVDALLASGRLGEAVALWTQLAPPGLAARGLTDPGFEEAFSQHGLGWRVGSTAGARSERDPRVRREGRFSLGVRFSGGEDVSYLHAAQAFPVEPERSYRLRGWWRGEELTTPSGPYLEVVSRSAAGWLQARSAPRLGTWDWSLFEIEFQVPRGVRLLEVRLRRDPVGEARRGLSGRLWLDDLSLLPEAGEPVP